MAGHGDVGAESRAPLSGARGYLTLAAGNAAYLEMAVDLALSLRPWARFPVLLVADDVLGARARADYPRVFDDVVPLAPRFREGRARKYGVAVASPFDETLFVDADCMILADPSSIWSAAGPAPLTFVGERLSAADDGYHHGFSTRALMRRFGLDVYLKVNSGVFLVRREGGAEAMDACLRCYEDEIRASLARPIFPWRFLGDELAFGVVGGRRGFSTFAGPGPMYWAPEIRALDPARPTKPVLHFIAPIPAATLETLLAAARERRRAADLPWRLSYAWWRNKARKSGLGWMAQRLHRTLVGRTT